MKKYLVPIPLWGFLEIIYYSAITLPSNSASLRHGSEMNCYPQRSDFRSGACEGDCHGNWKRPKQQTVFIVWWRLELGRKCTSFGVFSLVLLVFGKKWMWLHFNNLSTVVVSYSVCENLWNSGSLRQEASGKVNMACDMFFILQ